MINGRLMIGSIGALLLFAAAANAEDKEPTLVVVMGGAGGWGLSQGASSFGPEIGLEYTVIEHFLDIELATSAQFSKGQQEFDTDLVFKKPFELSDRLEFLIGAGPVWIRKADADSFAGEAIVEFVYSAWPERHVAFFIEPNYSYEFGQGHEQSIGVIAGLHIGIQ
jgi:hypothetical protein